MADTAPGTPSLSSYRPSLDGIRALAVYLVVAFHAGIDRLAGGFIGVDVFFVLSGYLVTQLLLRDLDSPEHRVRLLRFYARRARRLVPAAAVALIITAVVFAGIASFIEVRAAEESMRAAALYVSNWYFIGESADYFASDIERSPVIHYWSLSVEEQYYVLWPLLLSGIFLVTRRLGDRQRAACRALVLVCACASLVAAWAMSSSNLPRAYFGTDTRAYQLLLGAVLALAPGIITTLGRGRLRLASAGAAVACALALVAVATSAVDVGPVTRGMLASIFALGLIITVEAAPTGIGGRVLGWAPIAYLGRISYGTYLWHWLVVIVLDHEAELTPAATAATTALVATGIASLSFQVFEHPIRSARVLDRHRVQVVATAVAGSIVLGLVTLPRLLRVDSSFDVGELAVGTEVVTGGGALPTSGEMEAAYLAIYPYSQCEPGGGRSCELADGDGPTALIIGESHAGMLTPMLEDVAAVHDLDLHAAFLPFCPWPRGARYPGVGPDCFEDQEAVFEQVVPALDPDIVFLAHRAIDDPIEPPGLRDRDAGELRTAPDVAVALDERVRATINGLRADGRTVVVFEPVPIPAPGFDPLICLTQAASVEECRFVATAAPLGEEVVFRELAAEDDDVVTVDLDHLVCPFRPICDPVVDGMIVRHDHDHVTTTYARTLADEVEALLAAEGVFT